MARSRDGIEIAYRVDGERGDAGAPTVVLVHGWAGDRTVWAAQVAALAAARYRVVTMDLGGHGESGVGRTDWNLRAFGDDVAAVVEDVGASDVVLVGHSMGGDAIVFAARSLGAGRVRGLVWLDAFRSLGDEPVSSAEDVAAFLAPFEADFAGAVDAFARGMFSDHADPALVDRIAASMAGAPRDAALGSLGCALNRHPPVIAINPDVSPTDVDSLRRHGVAPTIVLSGVGHFLMLEDPEQCNRALLAALASLLHRVQVRRATIDDADALVALWDAATEPTRIPSDGKAIERLLARDPDALLVAVDDVDTIVGSVIVGFDGWRCHLYRMAVDATHRRAGIATALIDAAAERARRVGAVRLDAMVDKGNADGIAFWSSRGFVEDTGDHRWSRSL